MRAEEGAQAAASILDQMFRCTYFRDRRGLVKREGDYKLRDLERAAHGTTKDSKSELPCILPATFGDHATEKGCLRNTQNLLAITGVMVDYDAGEISMDDAEGRLRAAGVGGMLATTASHRVDHPKFRGIFPTSKSLAPECRDALWARINGLFDGALDPASFVRVQYFYIGSVKDVVGDLPPMDVRLVEGRPIDQADELDETAIYPEGRRGAANDNTEAHGRLGWPVETIRECVMAVPNGGKFDHRSEWLRFLAAIHHETEGSEEGREIAHEWSANWEGGDDPDQTDAAWDSFRTDHAGGVTFRSIVREAMSHGWETPREDFSDRFEDETHKDSKAKAAGKNESTLRFRRAGELTAATDAFDFVEGLLFEGQTSVVYGAPSVGKTFSVLDLAMHVALGRDWNGCRIERGGVLYITLEGADMQKRFKAWCKHQGISSPEALPIAFADGSLNLRKDEKTRDSIIRYVRNLNTDWSLDPDGVPVRWIIVDTLSRAMAGGNENAGEDMGALIDGTAEIVHATGAHLTLVHHPGKDESKGSRGHSSLLGNTDTEIEISRIDDVCVGRVTRQKEGDGGFSWAYVLDPVDLPRESGELF